MNCPQIPELDYTQFSKSLHDKFIKNRIPFKGGFDITGRCNLKCVHCYIKDTSFLDDDLTYQEICHILDQLADEGCLWLTITGGEPILRHDFCDIYRYAKQKGFLITLFTNGTLLTPPIVEFLAEQPPFAIEISLYGITAETYEKVTGVPGSFNRCIKGIELVLEHNLPLKLKTMVLTINKHEFKDMRQYAKKLGVIFRHDAMINAKIDGSTEPIKYRLSPADIVNLELSEEELFEPFQEFCDNLWGLGANGSDYLYVCGAGTHSFHITCDGKLNVCVISRKPGYDLCQGTLHEGFHSVFPQLLAKKRTRFSACQRCPMMSICGQCPSWAELEHGDPEATVEFLCQLAHFRVAAFKTDQAGVTKA